MVMSLQSALWRHRNHDITSIATFDATLVLPIEAHIFTHVSHNKKPYIVIISKGDWVVATWHPRGTGNTQAKNNPGAKGTSGEISQHLRSLWWATSGDLRSVAWMADSQEIIRNINSLGSDWSNLVVMCESFFFVDRIAEHSSKPSEAYKRQLDTPSLI